MESDAFWSDFTKRPFSVWWLGFDYVWYAVLRLCFWRVTSDCTKAEAIFGRSFDNERGERESQRGRVLTFALMFPSLFSQHCVAPPEYLFIYLPICVCLYISLPVCHWLSLPLIHLLLILSPHPSLPSLHPPQSSLHFCLFSCVSLSDYVFPECLVENH